jgi:hypothetical protein
MLLSFLCLSQVRTWTSNVICYGLFCVCHKSGPELLTSYVLVFFVSVTSQDLTSNVICYCLFCVCRKSGLEPLTSYVMVFLCVSQVSTWTSNVVCYCLFCVVIGNPLIYWIKIIIILSGFTPPHFCVCHKSGPEPLTSYVMVFFVSVTSQGLNL